MLATRLWRAALLTREKGLVGIQKLIFHLHVRDEKTG